MTRIDGMAEDDWGDWVLYEDYQALETALADAMMGHALTIKAAQDLVAEPLTPDAAALPSL
jgi:hypothetical protein